MKRHRAGWIVGAATAAVAAGVAVAFAQFPGAALDGGCVGSTLSGRYDVPHAFYFTRGIYSSWGRGWRGSWAVDWPKSDCQFNIVLRRLTGIDAYPEPNGVALDDPELRRFPFLYVLEVGSMDLSPAEVEGLRSYLLAGGFMMVDDFWGTQEWLNFEYQMQRVFPEFPIVELTLDHELFRAFYNVKEVLQVPNVRNARYGITSERDGYVPYVKAIFDNENRLMVVINQNTDLGDAWEWAEQPDYPLKYSTYAFQVGVNSIIYSMSH
ncbi:MAG: DUF4159 domain-containing protein [Gemmatimonadetes bacterium]|nr:DUF4159 domain-containing protein [Gemmatimonadota bacterium]